jgi:hypothetical protein
VATGIDFFYSYDHKLYTKSLWVGFTLQG